MTHKALRILIADPQHFQRMKIERIFNRLDCYRIAPVQNLAELLTLVDYGCEPFDLLVINAHLAGGRLDLHGFLLDQPHVRRALVYNAPDSGVFHDRLTISQAPLPAAAAIEQLLASATAPRGRPAEARSRLGLRA
jgi:hypothetical protein